MARVRDPARLEPLGASTSDLEELFRVEGRFLQAIAEGELPDPPAGLAPELTELFASLVESLATAPRTPAPAARSRSHSIDPAGRAPALLARRKSARATLSLVVTLLVIIAMEARGYQ